MANNISNIFRRTTYFIKLPSDDIYYLISFLRKCSILFKRHLSYRSSSARSSDREVSTLSWTICKS